MALWGRDLPANEPLRLEPGWRWIGYFPPDPCDLPTALASIDGAYDFVLGESGTYTPLMPPYLNTLHRLEPGQGYLIRVRRPATLAY